MSKETFGEKLHKFRTEQKLPLRKVASIVKIDAAILSKLENGERKATREQVIKLSKYYKANETEMVVAWLSDKIIYEVGEDEQALKALQVAEEKVAYSIFKKIDRKKLLSKLKKGIKKFTGIEKAWIYGSFSRGDDGPKSDVDIALKTDDNFSYFDLAEVQFKLEKILNRKVDVGFIDAFKPYILEQVKPDLKLIYER